MNGESKSLLRLAICFVFVCQGAEAQGLEEEPWAEGPAAVSPSPSSDPAQLIARALEQLPEEPCLESLEEAALRYLDAHPQAVRRLLNAPRRAALLPEVRFVADWDRERDESLDRYQDEPDRWGADSDDDLGFQLSLTWRLDRLVYSPDSARAHGVLMDRAERREAVLSTLVRSYFERRKLLVMLHISPPADPMAYWDARVRADELRALIDALTGGAMGRHASF